MTASSHLVSIFWPDDITNVPSSKHLVVMGYRIDAIKIVVIDLVSPELGSEFNNTICGRSLRPMKALGTLNYHSDKFPRQFQFDNDTQSPVVQDNELAIFFRPSKSRNMEYFSIDPISIDIFCTSVNMRNQTSADNELDRYSAKLDYHFPAKDSREETRELLRYINLTEYSRFKLRKSPQITLHRCLSLALNQVNAILALLMTIYEYMVKRTCSFASLLLEYPIFVKKAAAPPGTHAKITIISLCMISYTFHQINSRLKQLYNLPGQFKRLRASKTESEALILKGTKFSPTVYIRFYNTLWLILNDTLLGVMTSNLIHDNRGLIISKLIWITDRSKHALYFIVNRLMNSPAGFKLNNELSAFLGELVLWVIDFWDSRVINPLLSNLDMLTTIVSILVRFTGFSLFVAILTDTFNLATWQLHGFYIACTRIYHWQYHTLQSLFRLFYGKKYNVLRHRIDSNYYEFDELMAGIILFTILIYLLPTVIAFYLTFAFVRVLCIGVNNILESLLISFNHLPLGIILLRFKGKERLPSGIIIEETRRNGSVARFSLITKCLSFREIVAGYFDSTLKFNLANYNMTDGLAFPEQPPLAMEDIIDNWRRISPISIWKDVIFGEVIRTFDYKKMF